MPPRSSGYKLKRRQNFLRQKKIGVVSCSNCLPIMISLALSGTSRAENFRADGASLRAENIAKLCNALTQIKFLDGVKFFSRIDAHLKGSPITLCPVSCSISAKIFRARSATNSSKLSARQSSASIKCRSKISSTSALGSPVLRSIFCR